MGSFTFVFFYLFIFLKKLLPKKIFSGSRNFLLWGIQEKKKLGAEINNLSDFEDLHIFKEAPFST